MYNDVFTTLPEVAIMLTRYFVMMLLVFPLLACSSNEKEKTSHHPYREQKQVLDKAKEVDRLADDLAEQRRRTLEENDR